MKIYLAGAHTYEVGKLVDDAWLLNSFLDIKDWMKPYIKNKWNFMLDSGAFTFMGEVQGKVDWDTYIENYADTINKLDIDLFVELDIETVVGLDEVERLREKLEKLTEKDAIPVWHQNRGKQYFIDMCKKYDYVAIGATGRRTGKWLRGKGVKYLTWFIDTAHKNNCKIHGLGFTRLTKLKKYKFDSVDSTSWISGNKYGGYFQFDGETLKKEDKPVGTRIKNPKKLAVHNFKQWIKFQRYMERY